jgi:hypothetical protein
MIILDRMRITSWRGGRRYECKRGTTSGMGDSMQEAIARFRLLKTNHNFNMRKPRIEFYRSRWNSFADLQEKLNNQETGPAVEPTSVVQLPVGITQ